MSRILLIRKMFLGLGLMSVVALTSGCALTSKAEALDVRWFSPESSKVRTTAATQSQERQPPKGQPFSVELGRVTSGINLREKIAYRDAAFEMGFYDDKRWTERPEVYVRRELSRTLFEEHGLRRSLSNQSPTLEVEVVAFEELRSSRAARVQLHILLHDDSTSLLEKTITIDRAIPPNGKRWETLVQAMADALDAAAEEVAKDTETTLKAMPATTTTPR